VLLILESYKKLIRCSYLTILSNAIRQQHIKQQKTAASNLKFEQNKRMIDVQHETRCKIEIGSTKDVLLIYIYIYIYEHFTYYISHKINVLIQGS
jgi:hypothetical protein